MTREQATALIKLNKHLIGEYHGDKKIIRIIKAPADADYDTIFALIANSNPVTYEEPQNSHRDFRIFLVTDQVLSGIHTLEPIPLDNRIQGFRELPI